MHRSSEVQFTAAVGLLINTCQSCYVRELSTGDKSWPANLEAGGRSEAQFWSFARLPFFASAADPSNSGLSDKERERSITMGFL